MNLIIEEYGEQEPKTVIQVGYSIQVLDEHTQHMKI